MCTYRQLCGRYLMEVTIKLIFFLAHIGSTAHHTAPDMVFSVS